MTKELTREVSRLPEAPELNSEAIELLTNLCFRKNDVNFSEVKTVFIFGSTSSLPLMIEETMVIVNENKIENIIIAGGINPLSEKEKTKAEADIIFEKLYDITKGMNINFYKDSSSRNNLENVVNAMKVYDFSNDRNVCFIHKYHAAGRTLLTLKKYLPEINFLQHAFIANNCDPKDWFDNHETIQRVWGEYLRIQKYGARGDIDYSSVTELLSRIEEITA